MKAPYTNDCERGCRKHLSETNEWDVEMCGGCCKLAVHDWLSDIPANETCDIFEIRFKDTHKGFYKNVNDLVLSVGDIVAVEAPSGHDIGIVSLSGPIVLYQLKRQNISRENYEFKKIYRKAKQADIEKWQEAIAREHATMIRARQLAASLRLDMKIGDVEFQGDGSKAIFYYIAEERVDFRELIKRFAEEFRIRVEMRQIGARQEAGLIGGLGACGRELCCSQWMSNFATVNTHAARWQDLSLNPQKLTGQCGKLKCCLNHEVAAYIDAQKEFPRLAEPLETQDGQLFLQKTDILKGVMYFTADPHGNGEYVSIPVARVKEIMSLNKQGKKIAPMLKSVAKNENTTEYKSAGGEDSITRFDKKKKPRDKNHRQRSRNTGKNFNNNGDNTKK